MLYCEYTRLLTRAPLLLARLTRGYVLLRRLYREYTRLLQPHPCPSPELGEGIMFVVPVGHVVDMTRLCYVRALLEGMCCFNFKLKNGRFENTIF